MDTQSNRRSSQLAVEQIRKGDQEAFENLYLQHRSAFLQWAYKQFQCSEEDGKELYQVVTLIMYDNIMQQKLVNLFCSVQTYLCAIAKNKWKEWQRSKQKYQSIETAFIAEVIEPMEEDGSNEELILLMSHCLQQLGGRCQEMLESYYYTKLSMTEISVNMGYKNAATAKNLKYKYLQRLRRMMIEREGRTGKDCARIVQWPSK